MIVERGFSFQIVCRRPAIVAYELPEIDEEYAEADWAVHFFACDTTSDSRKIS